MPLRRPAGATKCVVLDDISVAAEAARAVQYLEIRLNKNE